MDLLILFGVIILGSALLILFGLVVLLLGAILIPVFLIIFLFVWAIEWRGVGLTRRRFGKLQYPIVTLRARDTGKLVRLIGVIHIAEAAYWKKISTLIEQYPDTTVFYESISKVSDEEKALLTERELEIYHGFSKLGSFMRELGGLMGLTFQMEGLTYPEHWIRTDMTGFDFVRAVALTVTDNKLFDIPEWMDEDNPLIRWGMRKMFGHMFISKLFPSKNIDKWEHVIIGQRNVVACIAIDSYRNKGDVTSLWGGAHLPGIIHMLRQMDYELIDMKWQNAIDCNNYSLLQAMRDRKKASQENVAADPVSH